jgi:hypothetical protein
LYVLQTDLHLGLKLARFAVDERGADPPRLTLLLDYLIDSREYELALSYVETGLVRNPRHDELRSYRDKIIILIQTSPKNRSFALPGSK